MKCEHIKRKLERYIDGELNPADRKQVEEHLTSCMECTAELARLQSLQSAGEGDFIPEPPPEYWNQLSEDVRSTIADLEPKKKKAPDRFAAIRRWIWPEKIGYRFIGLAATAVLVFFIIRTVQVQRSQIPFFRGSVADDKKEHIIDGVALPATEEKEREDKSFTEDTDPPIAAVPEPEPETAKGIRAMTVTKARAIADPPSRTEEEKAAQIGAVADKDEGIGVSLDEVVVVTQPDKKTEQAMKQKPPIITPAIQEYAAQRAKTDAKSEKPGFYLVTTDEETTSGGVLNTMIRKAVRGTKDTETEETYLDTEEALIARIQGLLQNAQSDDQIIEILENNIEEDPDQSLREAMVRLGAEILFIRAYHTRIMIHISRALKFYQKHEAILKELPEYNNTIKNLEYFLNEPDSNSNQ